MLNPYVGDVQLSPSTCAESRGTAVVRRSSAVTRANIDRVIGMTDSSRLPRATRRQLPARNVTPSLCGGVVPVTRAQGDSRLSCRLSCTGVAIIGPRGNAAEE